MAFAMLAWAYLAAVTLAAVVMWTEGDLWWPATVLLFAPRWIALVPLVPLAVAALVLRRGRLPVLLSAVVALVPVMGLRLGAARLLPGGDGPRLRVVTLNTGGAGNLPHTMPALLAAWDADVVVLQECTDAIARRTRELAGWAHHDEYGLCLLTRHPLLAVAGDSAAMARGNRELAAGIGNGAGYVVRYTIDTPAGPTDVLNLHLETPRFGFVALARGDVERMRFNDRLRAAQSANARRWANGGRFPVIVAGDFNATEESPVFRRNWGDLSNAFTSAGVGFGATRYDGPILARIDHVLTGPAWRPRRAVVGPDVGSDHRPLIVDLEFGK
jgi:endonuclease/exonuclease/phosphatase (EEP) superfamily protein YafD